MSGRRHSVNCVLDESLPFARLRTHRCLRWKGFASSYRLRMGSDTNAKVVEPLEPDSRHGLRPWRIRPNDNDYRLQPW